MTTQPRRSLRLAPTRPSPLLGEDGSPPAKRTRLEPPNESRSIHPLDPIKAGFGTSAFQLALRINRHLSSLNWQLEYTPHPRLPKFTIVGSKCHQIQAVGDAIQQAQPFFTWIPEMRINNRGVIEIIFTATNQQ